MHTEYDPPPESEVVTKTPTRKATAPRYGSVPGYLINLGLLAELSPKASKLLFSICLHAGAPKRKSWLRMRRYVEETGLCEDSIRLAKKELKTKGIIHYDWSPKYGCGHWIWLAFERPNEFSADCLRYKNAREQP
jgi:hypothetical protein